MTTTRETPSYIIPDPRPTPRREVIETGQAVDEAESEEQLFQAIQQVILRTSFCRAPVEIVMATDQRGQEWESTRTLLRQWADRCYGRPNVSVRNRCRRGCHH